MKPGDAEYDLLVERLRRERGGINIPVTVDTGPALINDSGSVAKEGLAFPVSAPKKRGRPPGVKNKPKVIK